MMNRDINLDSIMSREINQDNSTMIRETNMIIIEEVDTVEEDINKEVEAEVVQREMLVAKTRVDSNIPRSRLEN